MKGMHIEVYRCPLGECTNRGVSSQSTTLLLVGPGIPEIFEDSGKFPVVKVALRRDGSPMLVPVEENGYPMFGGNFGWTSDSRFRQISESPVPIHDRYE